MARSKDVFSWVGAAVVGVAIVAGFAGAAPRPKAKVLRVGDNVTVHLNGDEARLDRNVARAGLAGDGQLTLPVQVERAAAVYYNQESAVRYHDALEAGDRVGLDKLVAEGRAARVKVGTAAVVLARPYPGQRIFNGMPAVPGGVCRVRFTDGSEAGKVCEMPVRNLR